MTVDVTKIKVGDRVVFEAIVSIVDLTSDWPIIIKDDTSIRTSISASLLIEHKPKPIEFKVGDIVYRNSYTKNMKYEIIALYKSVAWCIYESHSIPVNFPICYLKHVNED